MSLGFIMGISLVTVTGVLVLRRYNETYAFILALCGGCVVLLGSMGMVKEIVDSIKELSEKSAIESGWLKQLLKVLGICYICKFGADICRDAGESAMAGYVELAGKIMMVVLSLPMLGQIAQTIINLIDV